MNKPNAFTNYVITRGWLHLILLTGVGIFTFPFLWMVATSMKTDDELVSGSWIPSIPSFVGKSPYVLNPIDVTKPLAVSQEDWDRRLPELETITRDALIEYLKSNPQGDLDASALAGAATSRVLNDLVGQIKTSDWSDAGNAMFDGYRLLLSPKKMSDAILASIAMYELRGVNFRTLDANIVDLSETSPMRWQVESGPAEVITDASGKTYLRYHFKSSNDPPIVLKYDFVAPADPSEMHKLIVSTVGDNSWHRVSSILRIGSQEWQSQRDHWIAQRRAGSMLLQPPTFEDETLKVRNWIPMKLVASTASPLPERTGSLRLTIQPSSTLEAIAGKMQFNYSRAFRQVPFVKYVINSLILVGLSTFGALFSSTFVAYAFARLHWPGRSVALVILLSTMMLPAHVTMIPSFMIWKSLGWYNTLNPMWVPSWLGSAFFIFLMTQHMKTIPKELEEAARLDGLNAVQTWYYIILPLVKPAAAAIAIMTAMGAWNDFMGPLVYLRDQTRFPLSLGLFGIRVDSATDWTMIMAGNVLMTLPVIILFIVFQKYFVQGMTMSGMKG